MWHPSQPSLRMIWIFNNILVNRQWLWLSLNQEGIGSYQRRLKEIAQHEIRIAARAFRDYEQHRRSRVGTLAFKTVAFFKPKRTDDMDLKMVPTAMPKLRTLLLLSIVAKASLSLRPLGEWLNDFFPHSHSLEMLMHNAYAQYEDHVGWPCFSACLHKMDRREKWNRLNNI